MQAPELVGSNLFGAPACAARGLPAPRAWTYARRITQRLGAAFEGLLQLFGDHPLAAAAGAQVLGGHGEGAPHVGVLRALALARQPLDSAITGTQAHRESG